MIIFFFFYLFIFLPMLTKDFFCSPLLAHPNGQVLRGKKHE